MFTPVFTPVFTSMFTPIAKMTLRAASSRARPAITFLYRVLLRSGRDMNRRQQTVDGIQCCRYGDGLPAKKNIFSQKCRRVK